MYLQLKTGGLDPHFSQLLKSSNANDTVLKQHLGFWCQIMAAALFLFPNLSQVSRRPPLQNLPAAHPNCKFQSGETAAIFSNSADVGLGTTSVY